MISACVEQLISPLVVAIDNTKLYLSIISFSLAIISLLMMRLNLSTNKKIFLIYSHIVFLMFPIILYATHTTCGYFCFSCYSNPLRLALLALPTTMIASMLISSFTIPLVLIKTNNSRKLEFPWIRSFIEKYSKSLQIKSPKAYVIDKPDPSAFSFKTFKSAIFLSVGMLELFTKKEIEAVVLHELVHIKRSSSLLKLSHSILKIFSPFSIFYMFNHNCSKEEKLADKLTVQIQKSDKYLLSAKQKLRDYYKFRTN